MNSSVERGVWAKVRLLLPLVLSSVAPIVNIAANNLDEWSMVYLDFIYGSIVLSMGSILAAFLVVSLIRVVSLREVSLQVVCNVEAVFLFLFFMYFDISTVTTNLGFSPTAGFMLSAWLAVTGVVTWLTYRVSIRRDLTDLISVILFAYVMVPFGHVVAFVSSFSGFLPVSYKVIDFTEQSFRPNVYFFVLDQHIRDDVLQEVFGSSNAVFIENLETRGFQVARESLSNYENTNYSLIATFSMKYLFEPGRVYSDSSLSAFLDIPSGNNPVVASFRKSGYQFFLAEPPVSISSCIGIQDRCISNSRPDELTTTILKQTPLLDIATFSRRPIASSRRQSFNDPETVVLHTLALESREPFFLYAHILLPHAPYLYREDCSPLTQVEKGNADRHTPDEYTDLNLWRSLYVNQLRCTDRKMVAAIDAILEVDPDAIIIVQGDHGTNSQNQNQTPLESWSERQFTEGFGILNAIRLPANAQDALNPRLSPVNTFRLVFNFIADAQMELLPDKSLYVTSGQASRPVAEWIDSENRWRLE